MLLAFNANNTNTLIGLCDRSAEHVIASWRLSTSRERMADEWYAVLPPLLEAAGHNPSEVDAAIIASVVPPATAALAAMVERQFAVQPIIVGPDLDFGVRARVDNPREVGPDRLANTVAAFARYGGPAIVVDFGSATNFDVISEAGDFIGGAIAPGLMVSLDALTGRAARLFSVDLAIPASAIGTNTTTNLQAGAILGHLAMVEGLLRRIRTELGVEAPAIATGGLASIIAHGSPAITHYEPALTLDGLRIIYQRVMAQGRQPAGKPHERNASRS